MLDVVDLHKMYGEVPVVDGLTFTLSGGDVVALTGVNGAGKTTALRCIVGAERPDRGRVDLAGEPYDERRGEHRRRMCSLLDDTAWFPDMTVAEHVALYAVAHGEPPYVVVEALEQLGIDHLGDRVPATLSSGQRQRLRLAQALVRPWDVLVLDEPEQRLDAEGRQWLGGYLAEQARSGRAMLMASHDRDLCALSGARLIAMDR